MRFTETDNFGLHDLEFKPRDTRQGIMQLVFVYTVGIAVIVGLALNVGSLGAGLFSLLVTLLLCGLAFYTVMIRQNNVDLVLATEFQNLIFASAASHGSDFTMFLKGDGAILYANEGLRKMFPSSSLDQGAALDTLLEEGKVANSDREKMYSALISGKGEKLVFPIKDHKGVETQYIVSIQPLQRPPGVYVVRGREYVMSRTAGVEKPKDFKNTSLNHIDQAISNLPFGVYIIGSNGDVEFANHHLETSLGYAAGKLTDSSIRVDKFIYKPEERLHESFTPQEYKGDILLQRVNGALVKAQVQQHLLTNEEGEVTGVSGTVLFE